MQKIFKDKNTGRIKVQTVNTEPSLTQQQFKDQTDINRIMAQYEKMGISYGNLPNDQSAVYGDVSLIPNNYQEILHKVAAAEAAFLQLPAELRSQYNNNPQDLVDWLAKPENNAKAVELGLKKPKPEPTPEPPTAPKTPPEPAKAQ